MKAKINHEAKAVYLTGFDSKAAVLFGINIAPYNDDLLKDGWRFSYYDNAFFVTVNQICEDNLTVEELVKKIRAPSCGHNCCCSKGQ